jgi:hypothetical protein
MAGQGGNRLSTGPIKQIEPGELNRLVPGGDQGDGQGSSIRAELGTPKMSAWPVDQDTAIYLEPGMGRRLAHLNDRSRSGACD